MSKIMHDLNYVHNYYMDGADNIKLKPAYDSLMDKLPYENREFLLNLLKFLVRMLFLFILLQKVRLK